MSCSDSDGTRYRFAAFGARGTVTLRSDCVHSKTSTHLGWWEQTIPLSNLKPHYGTLTTVPDLFIWAFVFAVILVGTGIYGLIWKTWVMPQTSLNLLLLASGLFLGGYLLRHRKSEWVIFNAFDGGGRVGYTRQGPDSRKCDAFTEQLSNAIRNSGHDQSRPVQPSGEAERLEVEDPPPPPVDQ